MHHSVQPLQHPPPPAHSTCTPQTHTQLFFDLFLVAAVTAVVKIFTSDPTATGAGRFVLYLGLFHFTWSSNTCGVLRPCCVPLLII